MEAFNIEKLDTDMGIFRVSGVWDPLSTEIILHDIVLLSLEGWTDKSFWLTEQNFESETLSVLEAATEFLLRKR